MKVDLAKNTLNMLVGMERLELSRRKAQEPKSCVSTVPPHPQILILQITLLS